MTSFLEMYSGAHAWFPALADHVPGQEEEKIEQEVKKVANDPSFVAGCYVHFSPENFPSVHLIGPAWAVFRWTQVQLLYCLEYIRRYGPGRKGIVSRRVRNDVIDAQYAVTALLTGGLATRDKALARIVSVLSPTIEILG